MNSFFLKKFFLMIYHLMMKIENLKKGKDSIKDYGCVWNLITITLWKTS